MIEENKEELHVCVYCGQPAHFQFKNGKWCCSQFMSSCPANRKRNSELIKAAHNKALSESGHAGFKKHKTYSSRKKCITNFSGEHICVHCGQYAEYKLKNGNWCCKPFANQCPEVRKNFNSHRSKESYRQMWKNLPEETKQKMLAGFNRPETHKKSSQTLHQHYKAGLITPAFKGKHHSQETKDKIRISTVKYFEEVKRTGGAKFSKRACEFIDKLNESKGWHLQHALNGGEIIVGGYYLDGYDKDLNIVFEYDEPKHYVDHENNILRERDITRMKFIHNKLNCRFFRYNEKKNKLYEVNFNELDKQISQPDIVQG